MSGLEVAAGVLTIVAAFGTGAELLAKYRDRRKAKKAATAQQDQEEAAGGKKRLDQSLVRGRQEVRKEYDTDVARLGPEFQRGDGIAVGQLKDQLIDLQNNIITVLGSALTSPTSALEDTVAKCLGDLLGASERTRKGTVGVLRDQYQRMSVQKPLKVGLKTKSEYVSVIVSRQCDPVC